MSLANGVRQAAGGSDSVTKTLLDLKSENAQMRAAPKECPKGASACVNP